MTDFKTPAEKLLEAAAENAKRREKEVVECPECGTEILKDTVEEAIETAEDHDESRHGGERTTLVNGMLVPSDDVVSAAEDAMETIHGDSDAE